MPSFTRSRCQPPHERTGVPPKVLPDLLALFWNDSTCQMLLTFHDSLLKKLIMEIANLVCLYMASCVRPCCCWSLEKGQLDLPDNIVKRCSKLTDDGSERTASKEHWNGLAWPGPACVGSCVGLR